MHKFTDTLVKCRSNLGNTFSNSNAVISERKYRVLKRLLQLKLSQIL